MKTFADKVSGRVSVSQAFIADLHLKVNKFVADIIIIIIIIIITIINTIGQSPS
jgi:hypothetical protein